MWQIADDTLRVRGAFTAHEYGDVILPFVVLRRLGLVLEPCLMKYAPHRLARRNIGMQKRRLIFLSC